MRESSPSSGLMGSGIGREVILFVMSCSMDGRSSISGGRMGISMLLSLLRLLIDKGCCCEAVIVGADEMGRSFKAEAEGCAL